MKRRGSIQCLLAGLLCLILAGCGHDNDVSIGFLESGAGNETEAESADTGFRVMEPGEYDSKDTAVVLRVMEAEGKITFLNRIVNKNYTLRYDGTTVITDQYGGAMSAAQLSPGDIVDVNFQHIPKKCVSVMLSPSAWNRDVTDGFTMNQVRGQLSFDGEMYTMAERMVLLSEGQEIDLTDLNERDVLSVQGIDNTIYSILVRKGHGYLRLTGTEYFVDGFIEVGQEMVQRITEDMLLTVPEGEYSVIVRNGRHGGNKPAVIYRDEETVLDVSDLKGEEIKTGNVFFTLMPADANVYIDGEKVDTSTYVTLEYGIHQMIVKADGYETISQYLKVGQENANLNVEMEPDGSVQDTDSKTDGITDQEENETDPLLPGSEEETDDEGVRTEIGEAASESVDSQKEAERKKEQNKENTKEKEPDGEIVSGDGTFRVKINAPKNVEVYLDGSYIGLAPVSFSKKAGTHVISLRKNGYQTRSYTIQVDDEKKDMELSFSELVKKTGNGLNGFNGLDGLDTTGLGDGSWTNDILSQTLFN